MMRINTEEVISMATVCSGLGQMIKMCSGMREACDKHSRRASQMRL